MDILPVVSIVLEFVIAALALAAFACLLDRNDSGTGFGAGGVSKLAQRTD